MSQHYDTGGLCSSQTKLSGQEPLRNQCRFFTAFPKMEASKVHLLHLFFLLSNMLLLICLFVMERKTNKGHTEGNKRGTRVRSGFLIIAKGKKMGELLSKQTTSICFTTKQQQISKIASCRVS